MASEFVVQRNWNTNQSTPVRWIISHAARHKLAIAMLLLGSIGNAVGGGLLPYYGGLAFDAILQPTPDQQALAIACGLLIFSQVIRSCLQFARNFGSELLGQRLERDTREELYGSLLGKSMRFHDQHSSGEMMARATNDVHELALMFSPGINLVIGSGTFLIVPLVFSPLIHPSLIATPLAFVILYILSVRYYLGKLSPITNEVRATFGDMNSAVTQSIEGIETVKGAAQEQKEIGLFNSMSRRVSESFVRLGKLEAVYLPLLLLGLAQGTGFLHAILLLRSGTISVGDVVNYMGQISNFGFPVFTSLIAYSQASAGLSSARRVLELIVGETELDQNRQGYDQPMRGELRFENVSFRYKSAGPDGSLPTHDTLHNVSFTVQPGETLAVVGQTGAGKTTIAKLINRIYDRDTGRVTVDGVDVSDWNLAALRRQVSIIEQDVFLFSRSIGANIAFSRPSATQKEIEQAARAAQAHGFIQELPNGYDTVVGERGVMLSGGQRQRIALARAFLTQPAILILDDSTSAIDSATEDQIQRAIEVAAEGRTTILITHRLSQIRRADKILVLKRGEVVAAGSHDQLMVESAAYREIFVNL